MIDEVWKVTVSLTRDLEFQVDNNENKGAFEKWLKSTEGKLAIAADFKKDMRVDYRSFGRANTDIAIEEIELKEYEVSKYDTDPRV